MKAGQNSQPLPLNYITQADEGDEGGLELGQILGAIRRRLLLIAGIATVVASAAALAALADKPVYEGKFEILTEPVTVENQVISSIPDTLSNTSTEAAKGVLDATKIRVLESPKVLDPVVEDLRAQYPNLRYGTIIGGLDIKASGENILEVSYRSGDRELAQAVLQQISKAYLDFSLEDRQSDIRRGIRFVEEQLPQLQNRVSSLEDQLQSFRQQYGLVDPTGQGQQLSTQVNSYEDQRLATQVELREAQALYTDLQKQLTAQTSESATSSALGQNSRYQGLLNQLQQIDQQIAQDSALYLESSPNIQLLQEQRQNLLPLLDREGQRVQEEVASHIRDLEARNQALTQTINLLNQRLSQFPGMAREYGEIQRNLQIASDNLNQFLAKREGLRIDAAQREVPWQILTPPTKPSPSAASVQRNLMLGVMLGLLLGVGAALAVDRLNNILHTAKEVKNSTKLPLLGVIPFREELAETTSGVDMTALIQRVGYNLRLADNNGRVERYHPAPFFEAFRSLYTNIRLLSSDNPIHSFVISSSTPVEGKSTISEHLAQAAAVMGQRVLLVDADLRCPRLHERMGLVNIQGLTNILSSELSFKDVIQRSPQENNLFVLTAGSVPPDPIRLLSSQKMQHVMEDLHANFDLVIYDTPPLLGFADAYLIAAQTDGILMVAGLGRLKRFLLKQALEELRVSGTPMLGLVANGAKNRTAADLYGRYQRYYAQGSNQKTLEEEAETNASHLKH